MQSCQRLKPRCRAKARLAPASFPHCPLPAMRLLRSHLCTTRSCAVREAETGARAYEAVGRCGILQRRAQELATQHAHVQQQLQACRGELARVEQVYRRRGG